VSRARLERQSVLLLTPTRASTPAKAKIRVKAKADARRATMVAKARTLARARVDAPLTNPPKNSQKQLLSVFWCSKIIVR
jgi:hypothetical protein